MLTVPFSSLCSVLSAEVVKNYIDFAMSYSEAQYLADNDYPYLASTTSTFSSLGLSGNVASSATAYTPDPHAVPDMEGRLYYKGLHSEPRLLHRTSKEKWIMPRGPWAEPRSKELCEVFNHPINKVWNSDLGWKVVKIMDAHTIRFTTIDVVRFKTLADDRMLEACDEPDDEETIEAKKAFVGPVTIWIGVFPESTSATAAHDAAQDVLALLEDYQITDVDIDFRESFYTREVGPQLLKPVNAWDPLIDVVGPLTPTLGLPISTKARPDAQGTMAVYLAEGGGSDRLLGLSCRHVLIGSNEANIDYVYGPGRPPKDVLLLGRGAFTKLIDSIKLRLGRYGITTQDRRRQIKVYEEEEKGTNAVNAEKATTHRIWAQKALDKAEKAMDALDALHYQVNKEWKRIENRVLGHILCSPALSLGVGEQRFTEDWGVFLVDRAKLGDGFSGNAIDLGMKLFPDKFRVKCFSRADPNWKFEYPLADRLLQLTGILTDDLMHNPDICDSDGEPSLLVFKGSNGTDATVGRANGVFSIVRDYFNDMSINQTSMEWAILNYASKSEAFSQPGDSGSVIADLCGRVGGMLTGGSGNTSCKARGSDITYATPFWWLLERIKATGFPNAHLDVLP